MLLVFIYGVYNMTCDSILTADHVDAKLFNIASSCLN